MSKFDRTFSRLHVNWLGKGVESSVGELKVGEEVNGIDFDASDSGVGSDCDDPVSKRKMQIKEFQNEQKNNVVETNRNIKFFKNDSLRVRARCYGHVPCAKKEGGRQRPVIKKKVQTEGSKGEGSKTEGSKGEGESSKGKKVISEKPTCPWTLHVSKPEGKDRWTVKTFNSEHTCLRSRNLSAANSTFLSEHVSDIVRTNPDISGEAVEDHLSKQFGINISRMTAYRAKDKAVKKLRGDYHEQFSLLREYIIELKHRNPGTTVKLDFHPTTTEQFETRVCRRIFVCLGSLKMGFQELGRELLGLDGAFMKGPYPGQLLTAVCVDGNNGIYPVAYALVEAECKASWEWFLECLGDDLGLPNNVNFTFISDRQKGILPAINKVFPSAEHRFCLRHINENMIAKFRDGGLRDPFGLQPQEQHMLSLRMQWRAKCDILLNNICESFNSKLVKGRDKPIITALEFIREYLMKRIVKVQEVIDTCKGPLTPTATEILETNKKDAEKFNVIWNGENRFQVNGPWNEQVVVDMQNRECSCRKWHLTGIPCKHVVVVLWKMDKFGYDVGEVEDWVHTAYTLQTWQQVYSNKVEPIVGATCWEKSNNPMKILPSKHHKQVGRPKKKRKRSQYENEPIVRGNKLSKKGGTITYGNCKNKGHNSKTCKGQSSQATENRPRKKATKSKSAI
uniref:uncharacterized protein LOC122604935 n=1 Tax=Erigeron canadensis TaxID=72917 RepID=UPI001CB98F8F|nr:uncharacterized protein LOC122604935 [Erigeron canadensis]